MTVHKAIAWGLAVLLMASVTQFAAAQSAPSPKRLNAAKALLKASGASKNFDAVVPTMMVQIKKIILQQHSGKAEIVNEVFKRVEKRFGTRKQELIDQIAILYAQKMTTADMNALTAFYSTGPGAKFVQLQPQLIQESALIGQKWGREVGQKIFTEVIQDLKKQGIAQ